MKCLLLVAATAIPMMMIEAFQSSNRIRSSFSSSSFVPSHRFIPNSNSNYKSPRCCLKMMEELQCDVLVIGGGPAGCTCAMYTSRAQLSTIILDKCPASGALAITSTIANYPGVESIMTGSALLDSMREQAIQYGTQYFRSQVFMIETETEDELYNKVVYTPDATYKARTLVLATGAMGRKPTFKGEDTFLGSGVSYCATCDGAFYQGSEVVVVGLNQEAIEEAAFLTKFASKVHWITRTKIEATKNQIHAHAKEFIDEYPDIVQHWDQTRLISINGESDGDSNSHGGVGSVSLQEQTGEEKVIPVEGVFIYEAGSKPITDFIGESNNIEFDKEGGVIVNDEMATSVGGVYGIGDIRNTPFKQVVVAASDGCIAAMAIDRYLKGRKKIRVDWIHK